MSTTGDVSLKHLPYQASAGGPYDEDLSLSNDSSDDAAVHWFRTGKMNLGQKKLSGSTNALSLLGDEHMDEFDAACTILNELQITGVISSEEKHRRKNLVMQYLEFAANEYMAEMEVASNNHGPLYEFFRWMSSYSSMCCCFCWKSKASNRLEREM